MHIPYMAKDRSIDLDRAKRIIHVREDILKLDSQEKLAAELGVTRGAVGNWELGKPVGLSNLSRMAEMANVRLDWLARNSGPKLVTEAGLNVEVANATLTGEKRQKGGMIWLYGAAVGGEDGQFILNGNALDQIFAPPSLSGIPDAYAVQIVGDSMWPRYEDGETVFVNPKRRPVKGDYVIAQIHMDEDSPPLAYVKRLVRRTQDELILEQFNPEKTIRFDGASVKSVHYVLRSGE